MEIRVDILPKLITDLPEEPMQTVLSSLDPKDIVFWSWVDRNCHRKTLLQEIHTEYRNMNHWAILWFKFLTKTKYVGVVITSPLMFWTIGFLVSFGGLFLLTIMFSRFLCIFYLIFDYGSNQVYRREPTKERPGDRRTKAPEIDLIEGEGPSHPKTIIFNTLWLTFGLGFLTILSFFLFGVLQMITIVGISSGLETMRLTWYLLWPCGYQYFPFDGEYYSKAEWEREERLLDLKTRYKNQHVISTSSIRHQHFV